MSLLENECFLKKWKPKIKWIEENTFEPNETYEDVKKDSANILLRASLSFIISETAKWKSNIREPYGLNAENVVAERITWFLKVR